MIDVSAKYVRSKIVTSKFDRRFAISPLQARTQGVVRPGANDYSSEGRPKTHAVAPESHVGKNGVQPVPQSVAQKNDAVSPDVHVPDVRGDAGRPEGEFSPGKNATLDLRDRLMSSVAYYVRDINQNWQRGVDAFMNVGRLCAEANARLTTAEKSELLSNLPFGAATFSKFVRIGTDTRLQTPEIQRLLPPFYTTMYAVTLLTDEELKWAIADHVIYPDMRRAELQKWHRELSRKVVLDPPPKEAARDSAAVSLPTAPIQDAVQGGAPPFTVRDAVAPDEAPPEAVASTAVAAPPPTDEDILAFLDRRPLSAEDQRVFDAIMAALRSASAVVCERVRAELNSNNARSGSRAKAVSSRRCDDDASVPSALPERPTVGELVQTTDAADAADAQIAKPAKEVPLVATPEAPGPADAGIKYSDLQVPGFMPTRARPIVVVRRKSRRPKKKPRGPFETSPF
jgi:hypothetical protein